MVYFLNEGSVDYVEEAMERVNDFFNTADREFFKDSAAAAQGSDYEKESRLRLKELNRNWFLYPYRAFSQTEASMGRLKRFYRNGIRKMTSWFVGDLSNQQMDFNSGVVAYLNFLHEHETRPRQNFSGSFYLNYENSFNPMGSSSREVLKNYTSIFKDSNSSKNVVELGCGRGDFLACLAEEGILGQGADLSFAMVRHCLKRGLDVKRKDALVFLREFHDNSLGGIFSSHLLETLDTDYLSMLVRYAYRRLEKGGRLIFETANPRTLSIFTDGFFKNPDNTRPLDPDALRFILQDAGFKVDELKFINESENLLPLTEDMDPGTRALASALNDKLYGPRDYYIVCTR